MIYTQNELREMTKRAKWQEDISYKTIAEDLLCMNYHAFINFLHVYKDLGTSKARKLEEYLTTIL